MDTLPLAPLLGLLALALLWSALFTAVDAARVQLAGNRRNGNGGARDTSDLPAQALIFGATLGKLLVLALAGLTGLRCQGETGFWLGCLAAAILLLVCAEYLPRQLARRNPEAFIGLGIVLRLPLRLLQPLAWLLDCIARLILRPFSVRPSMVNQHEQNADSEPDDSDASEENPSHSSLPTSLKALERVTVNHILVPRSEVDGINLDDSIEQIIAQLNTCKHTRLPVFHNDINQVQAVLNTRHIAHLLPKAELTHETLLAACYEPYFVPESTPLQLQLLNFHKQQRRMGIVVDEYGEVEGIVTLEDILEEIVGEFEEQDDLDNPHIHPQGDGRYVIEGNVAIRELNRSLGWHLPSDGPKTLNGLVTEALESIPASAVCLKIGRYRLEILETEDNCASRILVWTVARQPAA
ncbi:MULTISPECIES: transporter associated domain-containing protein [unclassified Pseudomonas]|uniref:transporter associated domain-containing protein n=1 Tax=unclassified Pseudomonas TaxID=196821 RepID=UPI0021C72205|nr:MULTISPECIES: transporter associated domain-containing protein [unclassified Pseudomonas]MCU1730309.1 CBS domain-containing protein [Pseudomonas sp. 20P_3.2_Bac4]MCU1744597.1 CBS domain-containing protein [Pseudomonas sp. 20P_3.2_Bac5]